MRRKDIFTQFADSSDVAQASKREREEMRISSIMRLHLGERKNFFSTSQPFADMNLEIKNLHAIKMNH